MKISNLIIVALMLVGTQAHAIHAYRTETCTAKVGTKKLLIKRSLSDNTAAVRVADEDGLDVIYSGLRSGIDEEIAITGKESLELNVISETQRKSSSYDDGCWIGEEGSFKRSVDIQRISNEAKKLLSLDVQQSLELSCEFQDIVPMGISCSNI